MDTFKKYFEILGLSPNASQEEIIEAYRDLAKVWHPDRFASGSRVQQKAESKMKEINVAYSILLGKSEPEPSSYNSHAGKEEAPTPPPSKSQSCPQNNQKNKWRNLKWIYVIFCILLGVFVFLFKMEYFHERPNHSTYSSASSNSATSLVATQDKSTEWSPPQMSISDSVMSLFAFKLNEAGKFFKPDSISITLGSLTCKTASEAIVHFFDENQYHAIGWYEVWLLRKTASWEIIGKLAECDGGAIEVYDIDKDGQEELWLSTSVMHQGYGFVNNDLLEFNTSLTCDTIFSIHHNFTPTRDRLLYTRFIDIGKDNLIEIIHCNSANFADTVSVWSLASDKLYYCTFLTFNNNTETIEEFGELAIPAEYKNYSYCALLNIADSLNNCGILKSALSNYIYAKYLAKTLSEKIKVFASIAQVNKNIGNYASALKYATLILGYKPNNSWALKVIVDILNTVDVNKINSISLQSYKEHSITY
jgi:hypothetical protein